jgi:bifunctional DNA-binding transcriptional regulator/antitoxin component of YhaV-PrlF toxin-antitoxin module
MITKMTAKHQVTIPKKILLRAGLADIKEQDMYFDVEIKGMGIFLKPVTLVVEERILPKKMEKIESWASKVGKGDKIFNLAVRATKSLKNKAETAIASETSLKKDWLRVEEDEAWRNL